MKQAIADAFHRADEIAKALVASGAAPGKLVAVDSQQMDEAMTYSRRMNPDADSLDRKAVMSASPDVVIVRRSLVFRYKLERPTEKK